ncbi:MAG: hypothetical protein ACLU37_05815 [Collinsella sp.]
MVRVDIETIVMAAGPVPSLIVLRERCGKSDSTAPCVRFPFRPARLRPRPLAVASIAVAPSARYA